MIILSCVAVIGRNSQEAAEYIRSQMKGLPTPVSSEIKFTPDARKALGGKKSANGFRKEIYQYLQVPSVQ